MQLQIDTENKTIKFDEPIELSELFDTLNRLFPDNTWKDYKLEHSLITNWNNPIIIERIINIPYTPCYGDNPYWASPVTTYGTSSTTISQEGIFNIQC